MRKKNVGISLLITFLVSIIGICIGFIFYINRVVINLKVEVESEHPKVSDFLILDTPNAKLITDIEAIDMNSIGKYDIDLVVEGKAYKRKLIIRDSKPPVVETNSLEGYQYNYVEATQFIKSVSDYSEYKVYYKDKPNFDIVGQQIVNIVVEDKYKNKAIVQAHIKLLTDNIAPVISGVKDKLVYIGDTIAYKENITVNDNSGKEIDVKVDSSKVNLKKEGIYEAYYSAEDLSGNITKAVMKVSVANKPRNVVNIDELNKLTDDILANIVNDNMTKVQKAESIYEWVKSNISYINYVDKESWVSGAYDGIIQKKGDCFTYYSVSRQLLSRVGIENLPMVASDGKHYWNLINCGEGWYHFDTTRFIDDVKIFMWTDSQVENLKTSGLNRHIWDKTKVPPTP